MARNRLSGIVTSDVDDFLHLFLVRCIMYICSSEVIHSPKYMTNTFIRTLF